MEVSSSANSRPDSGARRTSLAVSTSDAVGEKSSGTGSRRQRSEQQILAALERDQRLQGDEEAVYFVLRGLGLPVTTGPRQQPKICISAEKMPRLFAALKRLDLRVDGRCIVVEPRSSQPGALERSRSAPAGPRSVSGAHRSGKATSASGHLPRGFVDLDGTMASALAPSSQRRRKMPTAAEHQDYIERLALPKEFSKRGPFVAAVAEEMAEPAGSPSSALDATPPQTASKPRRARPAASELAPLPSGKAVAFEEAMGWGPSPIEGGEACLSFLEEAIGPPDWWRMSSGRIVNATEQRSYCHKLSRPKRKVATAPVSMDPRPLGPTRRGLAAQRDLLARLAELRAAKCSDAPGGGGFYKEAPAGAGDAVWADLLPDSGSLSAFEHEETLSGVPDLPRLPAASGGPVSHHKGLVGWQLARGCPPVE